VPNLRIRDAGREYTYQLEGETATLGRGEHNQIDLQDAKASKEHCRLERVGARWKVVDLESKNGTRVNGEFRNKAWLNHGDVIQVGAAEMRFGLEGTSRRADAAAPAVARGGGEVDEEGERPLPPRRYKEKNLPLILSLASVGVILFFLLSMWAFRQVVDEQNKQVADAARKLVSEGRYDDAIAYMQQNADPDGSAYPEVEKYIAELRELKVHHERNILDQESKRILSRLGLLIRSYNAGHTEIGAEQILALMQRLKSEYAGTEAAEDARKAYPAWYAGKVPQRASSLLNEGGQLAVDWGLTLDRSDKFRKEWHFREARETIERFVTEREAILDAEDLGRYRELRDQELEKIDRLADSIYRGREALAQKMLVNKRYDDAIALYREVIEKFGIDAYARKAQAEIDKIQKLKTGG
jgi:hypothetical protein